MDFSALSLQTQILCLCTFVLCAAGIVLYFVYFVSFYLCLDGINQLKETIKRRNEMKIEKEEAINGTVPKIPGIRDKVNSMSPEGIAKTISGTVKKSA